jgi:hypothetical protein
MNGLARDVMRKLALRIFKDPTSANVDDARKLARAVLILVDGVLPTGKTKGGFL